MVEGPECHDNVVRVCRHGPREAIMRVTRDDPFARPCYDSGLSSIENTSRYHDGLRDRKPIMVVLP